MMEIAYLADLVSVSVIAVLMAISPGADFVMVTRNSLTHGRSAGLFSSLGISVAIWIHVFYSIAGLAFVISQSIVLFSIIKYLGAFYLLYIGWKTFHSKSSPLDIDLDNENATAKRISNIYAFKIGFITNALNPKTTLFFLSIFTQFVNQQTSLWLQIVYGIIISFAHLAWFSFVSLFFSHPLLLKKFSLHKAKIEKVIGCILIALGLKVATMSQK